MLCSCARGEKRGNRRHPANVFNAYTLTSLEHSNVNKLLRNGLLDVVIVTPQIGKQTFRGNFFKFSGDIVKWSFTGYAGTETVISKHLSSNNQMRRARAGYCKHNYSVIG